MGASRRPAPGSIVWTDLTVENAEEVRDFYAAVVGWTASPVDMGEYDDFEMKPRGADDAVVGVCHARGSNAELPPRWLVYVVVENLDESLARCVELGGEVVADPRSTAGGRLGVIRDPAGAVLALWEPGAGD